MSPVIGASVTVFGFNFGGTNRTPITLVGSTLCQVNRHLVKFVKLATLFKMKMNSDAWRCVRRLHG